MLWEVLWLVLSLLFSQTHCSTVVALTDSGPVELRACLYPGEGIYVTPSDMDEEFARAMLEAYRQFSARHGGYMVVVDLPPRKLRGSSVGAPLYAAMYSALTGCRTDVGFSGEIKNDRILPVGEVEKKVSSYSPVALPYKGEGVIYIGTLEDIERVVCGDRAR